MERQLDPAGERTAVPGATDRGIECYFNDEVATFTGSEKVEGIRLKSGRKIDCQVVVLAIGTVPTIELAKKPAGLQTRCGGERLYANFGPGYLFSRGNRGMERANVGHYPGGGAAGGSDRELPLR
jgi:hypothetical protein